MMNKKMKKIKQKTKNETKNNEYKHAYIILGIYFTVKSFKIVKILIFFFYCTFIE